MAWIGVDFDGTLATDADSSPIPAMVERVKRWLSQGIEVKILTARVNVPYIMRNKGKSEDDAIDEVCEHKEFIFEWCVKHIGQGLPITCSKDYDMYVLFDDRARQVVKDTGEIVGDVIRHSNKPLGDVIDEETGFRKALL